MQQGSGEDNTPVVQSSCEARFYGGWLIKDTRRYINELKSTIQKIRDTTTVNDVKLETVIEAKLVEGLDWKVESSENGNLRNIKEDVAD